MLSVVYISLYLYSYDVLVQSTMYIVATFVYDVRCTMMCTRYKVLCVVVLGLLLEIFSHKVNDTVDLLGGDFWIHRQ